MTGASDEFALIARYFQPLQNPGPRGLLLGIGDDAALLETPPGEALVASVDTVVEGQHYPPGADPGDIGFRAVAAATSDLAAMGARPLACMLALTLPGVDDDWLAAFSRGVGEALAEFAMPLVGGDTTRGATTVVTLQVLGSVPPGAALRRDGARCSERVCVSGSLGEGAGALAMLRGDWQPSPDAAARLHRQFYRPRPQLALGEALRGIATSAIDISDGLLADLGHLCTASGVGVNIEAGAVPLSPALRGSDRALEWALRGGDDYQLAFTLPAGVSPPPDCTAIGTVIGQHGLFLDGEPVAAAGFSHF